MSGGSEFLLLCMCPQITRNNNQESAMSGFFVSANVLLSADSWSTVKHALSVDSKRSEPHCPHRQMSQSRHSRRRLMRYHESNAVPEKLLQFGVGS